MQVFENILVHELKLKYSFLIFLAFALGVLFIEKPFLIFSFFIAIPFYSFLKTKPMIGVVAIAIFNSTIFFQETLPIFNIGLGSLHIQDLILFTMLIFAFRLKNKSSFTIKLLYLFILYLFISAIFGILWKSLDFNEAMRMIRYYFYFLLAYVVSSLAKTERDVLFLEKSFVILGLGVVAFMIAQYFLGDSVIIMPGRVERSAYGTFESIRILPPGQSLVFFIFIISMGFLVLREKGKLTASYLVVVLFTFLGVLMTYNRHFWVSAILCLMLFIALGGVGGMFLFLKRAIWGFGICALLIGCLFIGNQNARISAFSTTVLQRFESIFDSRTLTSSSLEYRKIENRFALEKIKAFPIFGIGPGNHYRPRAARLQDDLTHYIHNGYLGLSLHGGIPGLFIFLAFYGLFLLSAFKARRYVSVPTQRIILTGILVCGIAILPINMITPMFQEWNTIVIMGSMIGLSEAIFKVYGKDGEQRTSISDVK